MPTNQDLLNNLLILKETYPERMGDSLFAWDENRTYSKVDIHILEDEYVNPDQEGYVPLQQYLDSSTESEVLDWEVGGSIPKGTLVITLD